MFREVCSCDKVSGANGVPGIVLVNPEVVKGRAAVCLIQNMPNWRRPFVRFLPCIVNR